MQRREHWRGALGMGLYFNWVMYLLFYGPGLAVFAFDPSQAVLLGLLSHVLGLLHSAWLYNRSSSARALRWVDAACLASILLVTTGLAVTKALPSGLPLLLLFAAIGYASARLIVRWGAWFCSPEAAPRRGSICGIMIVLSYGALFIETTLLAPGPDGARIGLGWSAAVALLGGLVIIKLPIGLGGSSKQVRLASIFPVASVVVLCLVIFSLAILPFPFVLSAHREYPLPLASLAVIGYLVPMLIAWWSDRTGRQSLLIASFTLLGIGFALWTVTPHVPPFLMVVAALVLGANLCASMFLWCTAADRAEPHTVPLGFAVAVSLQVTAHTLTFAALPHIDRSIFASQPFMGASGVVLVLLGMGMLLVSGFRKGAEVETASEPMGFIKVSRDDDYALPLVSLSAVLTDARMARIREAFGLTERESDVLTLVLTGLSNKQIAQRLFISLSTTKFHVRNVLRKLQVRDRHEMREKVFGQLSG